MVWFAFCGFTRDLAFVVINVVKVSVYRFHKSRVSGPHLMAHVRNALVDYFALYLSYERQTYHHHDS